MMLMYADNVTKLKISVLRNETIKIKIIIIIVWLVGTDDPSKKHSLDDRNSYYG